MSCLSHVQEYPILEHHHHPVIKADIGGCHLFYRHVSHCRVYQDDNTTLYDYTPRLSVGLLEQCNRGAQYNG